MPSDNINQDGIYFITTGGEIYKGATRFGCGRVTKASTSEELASISGMARGDINVGYEGAKVFDGTDWQPLGGDTKSLQSMWQSDISTWTSGLVAGGTGSIITQITQDADGKVRASATAFPTLATGDADGQVKLGTQNAKVSGWDALVSKVDGFASIIDVNTSAVNAASGTFTNLTVTDTATFSVTNVSASSLTINGSTVAEIADAQIGAISSSTATSTANGVTVSVTTQGGSVTAVKVDATAFGNVMHFRDAVSNTANVNDPAAGDIVVIAGVTDSESTFKNGQEYIYTNGNTWELIGDQNTYAIKAAVDASFSAIATSWASLGTAAFVGTASTVSAGAITLPTCSAVAAYVSSVVTGLSSTVSASANGVEFSVTQTSGKLTSASLTGVGTAASKNFADALTSTGTSLPTESAVAAYVAAAISEALTWQTA